MIRISGPLTCLATAAAVVALAIASSVHANILFTNLAGSTTLQLHTADFFQQPVDAYSRQRCILVPILPDTQTKGCNFRPAQRLNVNLNNAVCTVALLGWADAQLVNCRTITEATDAIFYKFLPTLPAAGYPSDAVLAIVLPPVPAGEPAGPMTTPYLSHSSTVPDGFPAIHTVLLKAEDGAAMIDRFRDFPEVFATVSSEPGPWNDYFLSGAWSAFIWVMVVVNALLVLLSLVRLNSMHQLDPITVNLQTVIYGVGLASVLLSFPIITIRLATLSRALLDIFSTFLFSISLYLIVLLWSALIGQTKSRKSMLPLRIVIYLAILVTLVNFIYGMIFMLTWPSEGTLFSVEFSQFVFPASQLLVAGLFVWYGYGFYRNPGTTTSWQTRSAIIKLSIIVTLGFLAFGIKAILHIVGRSVTLITSVSSVAAIFIFLYLTFILRTVAVVMVLTINMKVARRPAGDAVTANGQHLANGETDTSLAGAGDEGYMYSWQHLRAGAGLQPRGVNVMLEELDQYGTTTVEDVGLFATSSPAGKHD